MVFYILSGIFLIFSPVIALLPPDIPYEFKKKTLNLGAVIVKCEILSLFLLLSSGSFCITYLYPLWTTHLHEAFDIT